MAYKQRLNQAQSISKSDAKSLILELDTLRAELDDIRTKYTALRALLAASTAPGVAYNTGTGLNAPVFTAA